MTPAEFEVTAGDREALSGFSCRSFGEPWTDEVERTIHSLADELALTDSLVARGIWAGDDLVAIAVWRILPQAQLCQGLVLAVETGHRRRGYARRLKQLEIDAARDAGCRAIVSKVHWGNTAMLNLNRSMGANVERDGTDPDYAYCIIPL